MQGTTEHGSIQHNYIHAGLLYLCTVQQNMGMRVQKQRCEQNSNNDINFCTSITIMYKRPAALYTPEEDLLTSKSCAL